MDFIAESKKNHIWRKTVWHTDPDEHPLTPAHSAEVYCCEEVNGYAVWYVRKLGKNDGHGLDGVDNGDYLLRFFAKDRRDEALEWAVLSANHDGGVDDTIKALDLLVPAGQKV
ncbi:hypothetical protein RCH09_001423 [Actimicrobium sp. GrIS 1.19]|jgi:hypothetical protein|uniref:hypothetical protein n=1 Tax=Actimicrobium sp. GrIS 1.19 TaxID=3071708 RepID=UPI002E0A73E2|nr:hypothetical protein [Actimicrobium sp. GrIS 1.19]